ncbi:Uncharacterized protein TCAP_01606 [Tolypocladium capitatum]|uniref:Fungal N-terminal domain-containing protein n=1 Tax=Tolypocladium capitatum TaxID=45235 RepID=A0A2K3QLR1_9HYPO|nr:Uncharacterized protein TCAP_01606 [Tolypocladium capitatum]
MRCGGSHSSAPAGQSSSDAAGRPLLSPPRPPRLLPLSIPLDDDARTAGPAAQQTAGLQHASAPVSTPATDDRDADPSIAAAAAMAAMAEKLSVTTAIIGLLAVGGRTIDTIWDLTLPATDAAPALAQALHEVKQCRSTVHILYRTFSLLESARLPFPARITWIAVDDLIVTLTDTVLAFSDLQRLCAALDLDRRAPPTPGALPTRACHQRLADLCARIRWHNLSMTMMTTILKCPGEADAQNARVGLERRMARLLTSNAALASRMRRLDDVFDGGAVDAESLPHYTRRPVPASALTAAAEPHVAPAETDEVGRGRALSPLSGYTLAGIPVLSIIPLPVTTDELYEGNDFYTFAYARRVGRELGELMQYEASQGTSRALSILLGRTNASNNGGSASSTGSTGSTGSTDSSNDACAPPVVDAPKTKKTGFRSMRVKNRWRAAC